MMSAVGPARRMEVPYVDKHLPEDDEPLLWSRTGNAEPVAWASARSAIMGAAINPLGDTRDPGNGPDREGDACSTGETWTVCPRISGPPS